MLSTPASVSLEAEPVAAAPAALRCLALRKRFGSTVVVDDLDLEANPGELIAILGPSGCGKTTTLRLIAGLEAQDGGTIEIGGRLVAGPGPRRGEPPERRRVGLVFQDYALFPHLSVIGNVGFGLPRGGGRVARSRAVLEMVGLAGYEERMPRELSGGEQQRVAVARALAPGPEVILLDEPFSNLDASLRASLREDVREILRSAGATAILVTHDQEEALSLADRVAVMLDGHIVQFSSPRELYGNPKSREIAAFVGEAHFLPADAHGDYATSELGSLMLETTSAGPIDILLRPESLRVVPADDMDPGNAFVRSRSFYGPHQIVAVSLDSGRDLRVRSGAELNLPIGSRCRVSVPGAVVAFPREGSDGGPRSG